MVAPLVGHAGDGNFHLIFMLDPDDPNEFDTSRGLNEPADRARAQVRRHLHRRARRRRRQTEYLEKEHGESLDVMRAIKRALDPNNLMNPGKLIPGL